MAEKVIKNWVLTIDVKKCNSCYNCVMACRDEYSFNEFPGYSVPQPKEGAGWIKILKKERGIYPMVDVVYLPLTCMNCRNAPCISASVEEAVYRRDDGIVMIDPKKARGQKIIVDSCPYNIIEWNQERNVAQKYFFDAHLLDQGWKFPRIVKSCPTEVFQFHKLSELELSELIKNENLEELYSRLSTNPLVFYKNLKKFTHGFIGGTVSSETNPGVFDCLKGVGINLYQNRKNIMSTFTDNFGDFKFDNIEENSGSYVLQVEILGYRPRTFRIDFHESYYMGNVILEKINKEEIKSPPKEEGNKS